MDTDPLSGIGSNKLDPKTPEEVLAVRTGQDLNAYRAEKLERLEIAKAAERHMFVDPFEWPSIEFNWNLSVDAQRFTLDGCSLDSFTKYFPRGLRLGWVELKPFDDKLCLHNRREPVELWTVGDKKKLAMAIEYISRGKPITPPLVSPLPDGTQVCLSGGNHRYTVAKFSNQTLLPIYVDPEKVEAISNIVMISWT